MRFLPSDHGGLSEAHRPDRTVWSSTLAHPGNNLLLDGHVRMEILKSLGVTEAKCLLSTDDEAYTYTGTSTDSANSAALHAARSLKNGLTEERIAAALDVSIDSIRSKRDIAEWNLSGSSPDPPRKARQYSRLRHFEEDEAHPSDRSRRAHGCAAHTRSHLLRLFWQSRKPEMLEEPPSAKLQATSEAARAMLEEQNEFS